MATTPVGVSPQLAAMEAAFGDALQRTAARLNAFGTAVGVVMKRLQNAATGTGGTAGTNAANGPNAGASVSGLDEKRLEKFKVALGTIGDAFVSAFSRGQSAVLSAVGAINPMALDTFNGSLTLLSQSLGEIFVPYIEAASRQIQQLSKWFDGLSGDTKTTIARVTLFAMATGGVITAARILIPLLQSVRVAALMMNAAMMANPVGAVVALTAAVAALAAAWYTVNSNAGNAGKSMGDAARTQVAQDAESGQAFNLTDISRMPEPYRSALKPLVEGVGLIENYDDLKPAERRKALEILYGKQEAQRRIDVAEAGLGLLGGEFPQADRETMKKNLTGRQQSILSRLREDVPAMMQIVPEERRKEIDRDPKQRANILREAGKQYLEQATKIREEAPDTEAEEVREAAKRREMVQKAIELPETQAAIQQLVAAYAKRRGIPLNRSVAVLSGDAAAPERRAMEEAVIKGLQKFDPDTDVSGETLQNLRLTYRKEPDRANDPTLNVGESDWLKPSKTWTIPGQLQKARELESSAKVLEMLVTTLTGGRQSDDFARFGKMPVQSRFTDGFGFAESMQLSVLNQSEGDAKLLLRQLQSMEKLMGSMARAIDQYAQKGGGDASSYMRGFIDLWR